MQVRIPALRPSCCLPEAEPIRREIACATEATLVDKGLSKVNWVTPSLLPIAAESAQIGREDLGSQIANAHMRKHEKADVVGKQIQTAKFQGWRPADPGVPRSALQGSSAPAQQRYPLLLAGGHVPEGLSYDGAESQVVMGVHQLPPARSLLATHGTNREAGDIGTDAGFCHGRRLTNPKGNCQREIVLLWIVILLGL